MGQRTFSVNKVSTFAEWLNNREFQQCAPCWKGRQAGWWGPGEDQAHSLKDQSFTRAVPQGKRYLKNTGETSKTSVFKCSHFAFSMTRVHLSEKKKLPPGSFSIKLNPYYQTHRHGEHICACQGAGGGGKKDWEFGISRCRLLYIEWINNRAQGSTFNILWWTIMEENTKK